MKILLRAIISLILFSCFSGTGICQEDEKIYRRALESAASGDSDSAFMSLHALLSGYPKSPHAEEALFSTGEYYYQQGDLRDASRSFFKILKEYPGSKARIFCYAYLLEISRKEKKSDTARALARALRDSRRLIFLFKETKEVSYTSLSGKQYRGIYYIDKTEIYIDGTLFSSAAD